MNIMWTLDENNNTIPLEPNNYQEADDLLRDIRRRQVAVTEIGDLVVSTVFLVIGHFPYDGEKPSLFETMVFQDGSEHECGTRRYFTWDDAAKGHTEVVDEIVGNTGYKPKDVTGQSPFKK